jgi:ribose transport system ATP-binding protein
VRDVSFDLHQGEILGFAGLMGAGRTETMRAIFGADEPRGGEIRLGGSNRPVRIASPRQAVRLGIALLTENRKEQGLVLPMPVRANITLANLRALAWPGGWVRRSREHATAQRFREALRIRCHSTEQTTGTLSGGNQQKVVVAKWLCRDCDVLIFDEPTRGIDVGSKFEVYQLLADLAGRGKGIIVVSSDMQELLNLCDRIAVMSAGRLVEIFERGQWTQDKIMSAALSGYAEAAQAQ